MKSTNVMLYLTVLLLLDTVGALDDDLGDPVSYRCEKLDTTMCAPLGYNKTIMPNRFNHQNQQEAGLEAHQFWPLVQINCSPYLMFFLCGMYFPVCIENVENYPRPLPVCRHVCERAQKGCIHVLKQYGFDWPDKLRCDRLAEKGKPGSLCLHNEAEDKKWEAAEARQKLPSGVNPTDYPPLSRNEYKTLISSTPAIGGPSDDRGGTAGCSCTCSHGLVTIDAGTSRSDGSALWSFGGIRNCAMPCRSPYFNENQRAFAKIWLSIWAALCFLSTFLTIVTFLLDMSRFRYPERPIVFLSFCYLMVAIGYIIRLIAGHEAVACGGDNDGAALRNTTEQALCVIVFFLIYGFGMASCAWWVVLSFAWFLSAALKWSSEAIERKSLYFHAFAWIAPGAQIVVALARLSVDGDPIGGVCYVGNSDLPNLRFLVIGPLSIYLFIGTAFLIAGFVSLFRIRSVIKQQGTMRTEKLENLMVRIGVFSVLYCVPATIVIACHLYEQHFRYIWEASYVNQWCRCGAFPLVPATSIDKPVRPDFSVFMLKYFMSLMVGVTSAFWICSPKTVRSWSSMCSMLCRCSSGNKNGSTTASFRSPSRLITSKSHNAVPINYVAVSTHPPGLLHPNALGTPLHATPLHSAPSTSIAATHRHIPGSQV